MTIKEIEFALKTSGVEAEDIATVIDHYKKQKTRDYEKLDALLEEMGYEKVFTDEFFGWADEDDDEFDGLYSDENKGHHKPRWDE